MCFRWYWPSPSALRAGTRPRFDQSDNDPGKLTRNNPAALVEITYWKKEFLFYCASHLTSRIWWQRCYVTSRDTVSTLPSPSWVSHSWGSQSPCCVDTQAASWKGPWRKELRHQPCEWVTLGRNAPASVELSEDCPCTSLLGWIFMWDPELPAQLS